MASTAEDDIRLMLLSENEEENEEDAEGEEEEEEEEFVEVVNDAVNGVALAARQHATALELRLSSSRQKAIGDGRDSRPRNTKKAYDAKQKEWTVRRVVLDKSPTPHGFLPPLLVTNTSELN